MIKEFNISTNKKYELVDVTDKVEDLVEKSGIKDGLFLVFVPHSTVGIISTENEPGLIGDWLEVLKKIVSGFDFQHDRIDDNASSHILSGLVGQEKIFIIEKGRMVRGTWQQIFLAEFDGPRDRKVLVKIIKNS